MQATFAKPTSLSYFKIVFETRDAGAPPTPSNVKAFDIEYKTENGDWKLATTYTRTGDPLATGGYDAVVKVKLDAPIEAKAVRLTNFDVLNGSTAWNGVSVAEFEAYTNEQADAVDTENVNHVQGATAKANAFEADNLGADKWNGVSVAEFEAYTNEQADAVDTENVNHVQGATAKANAFEADNLGADKAIDGKRGTRWSSGTAKPEKNTSTYLEVDLKATSKIGFLDIEFEERTVDVKPSNVKEFEIQYQAPGSSDWVPVKTVSNARNGSGYEPRVRVTLEAPIVAKKIRLTNFDIARTLGTAQATSPVFV